MREVKVVIPWRPSADRLPGFEWVCAYYRHRLGEDCIHVEVDETRGPFNKSALVNRAVAKFPGATIVLADADCFVCDHALNRAISTVGDRLIIPHNRRCYTTPAQARQVLASDPAKRVSARMFIRNRGNPAPAGVLVFNQELLMQHPMDTRFKGWGCEDVEWLSRVPHYRFGGPVFHIHHTKASRRFLRRNQRLRISLERQREARVPPSEDGMRIALFDVHRGHDHWFRGLFGYLRAKGHSVQLFTVRPPDPSKFDRLIIWNGCQVQDKALAASCKQAGVPHCYLEVGFFGQKTHCMLSPNGSVGGDLFSGEKIPDLPKGGEEFLVDSFREYSRGADYPKGDYIAGLLQLPNDFAIREHSSFRTMQEVVEAAEAAFPDDRVIFKTHPKQPRVRLRTKHPLFRGPSIWPHVLGAKRCIAVNSTALYEAAFAGVPATALGNCPLARHPDKHREIVHEILMRQIPVGSADIEERVRRCVGDFFESTIPEGVAT